MKRIVNGVTYNTETATRLAESRWNNESQWNNDGGAIFGTLYQTRGGAFFVDEEITRTEWNERERDHEQTVRHEFNPLSPDEAHKWLLEGEVEIFQNPFDDPPEATAEAEPGATIYIRVPASLKRSVDDAAKVAKVSGNVWIMRCVERCLEVKQLPEAGIDDEGT
jgi:predicted HicB family RNase H-like nuclease